MKLTKLEIITDIEGFQERIAGARLRLAELPTATNWKERKKVKAAERALTCEIDHVYRILAYAREALSEIEKPSGR